MWHNQKIVFPYVKLTNLLEYLQVDVKKTILLRVRFHLQNNWLNQRQCSAAT